MWHGHGAGRRRHVPSNSSSVGGSPSPTMTGWCMQSATASPTPSANASVSPSPSVSSNPQASASPISMQITFYSYFDINTTTIAYPKNQNYPTVHNAAGGTGTFTDPITVGSEKTEFAPGTVFYFPFLQKYGVMEDACPTCTQLWQSKTHAVRVWIGGDSTYTLPDLQGLQLCESYHTTLLATQPSYSLVYVKPTGTSLVNAAAIYNPPDPALTGLDTSTCTNAQL